MSFDLAEVLDATEPVDVEYLGKTIVAHVYKAGDARLTIEERKKLRAARQPLQDSEDRISAINKEIAGLDESSNGRADELEKELLDVLNQLSNAGVFQATVPVMVQRFEYEGEPLLFRGKEISGENIADLPDSFSFEVAMKAGEVWGRPFATGENSENGSLERPTETETDSALSPAQDTSPSLNSESPLAG